MILKRHAPAVNEPVGRMLRAKKVVHIADAAAEKAYTEQREPGIVAAVELGGIRTNLVQWKRVVLFMYMNKCMFFPKEFEHPSYPSHPSFFK
jgi:hypothetical protein